MVPFSWLIDWYWQCSNWSAATVWLLLKVFFKVTWNLCRKEGFTYCKIQVRRCTCFPSKNRLQSMCRCDQYKSAETCCRMTAATGAIITLGTQSYRKFTQIVVSLKWLLYWSVLSCLSCAPLSCQVQLGVRLLACQLSEKQFSYHVG